MDPVTIIVSFVVGALVVYAVMKNTSSAIEKELDGARKEAREMTEELATASAQRDAAKEQVVQITADRQTMKESFGSIASEQLKANRDEFLKQAGQRFEQSEEKHTGELKKRHEAIEKEFKGLKDSIGRFDEMQRKVEEQRGKDFGSLRQQVLSLKEETETLAKSSSALEVALRGSSSSRGKWGEMALRNIIEAAGMTEHCDFIEQKGESSKKRPDVVVKLPGDARIPIDAKVPLADYQRMTEETDPDQRKVLLKKHGDVVRQTMIDLAKRDYPAEVGGEVDYTVMFIPIESVVAAALEARPDLQQEAIDRRILLVTPVTLIALLRTVGLYWKQAKMAANAREIWDESRELHKRLKVFYRHLNKVGTSLDKAVKGFNSALGSFERNVLSQGRRVEGLAGIEASEALEDPKRIETQIRDVSGDLPMTEEEEEQETAS